MTEEERFLDFATVREMLYDAQERRGSLKYEQKWALQHLSLIHISEPTRP